MQKFFLGGRGEGLAVHVDLKLVGDGQHACARAAHAGGASRGAGPGRRAPGLEHEGGPNKARYFGISGWSKAHELSLTVAPDLNTSPSAY